MQNETIGSLFDLLFLGYKKMLANLPMLVVLLIIIATSEIVQEVLVPYEESGSQSFESIDSDDESEDFQGVYGSEKSGDIPVKIIPAIIIIFISIVSSYCAMACTLSTKGSFNEDLNNFIFLLKNRGLSLALALILQSLSIFIGMILLIVPGVYLSMRMIVLPFVVIYEDKDFIEAFDKSSKIMDGNKLTVFFFMILAGIVMMIAILLVAFVFMMIGLELSVSQVVAYGEVFGLLTIVFYMLIVALISLGPVFALPNLLYLKRSQGIKDDAPNDQATTSGPVDYTKQ